MRECKVGSDRAAAALAELRAEGFDPHGPTLTVVPDVPETSPEPVVERTEPQQDSAPEDVPEPVVEAATTPAHIDEEALISTPAGAAKGTAARRVPRWPILVIAVGAFVSFWGGCVGLGELAGFGPVRLLPGIADSLVINSPITLPLGVEAYAGYALWVCLAPADAQVSDRPRRFACWSSIAALDLGVFGQATYHLLVTAGVQTAPWPVVTFMSCLPVLVLGAAAALVHLNHRTAEEAS